ncbi:hypothetical protein PHYSODRAFT_434015, partial [Phytophthora sojae]
ERYSLQRKRSQFICKVSSLMSSGKGSETTYTCPKCSETFGGRVALCNVVRRLSEGKTKTCAQIWHDVWENGTQLP